MHSGQVPTPASDSEKESTDFKQLRRQVYHGCLEVISSTLVIPARFGYSTTCGDTLKRVLFPGILALMLDLEEAYLVALVRGVRSTNGVCPKCHVTTDQQSNHACQSALRSVEAHRKAFEEAVKLAEGPWGGKGKAEEIMHGLGLYMIFVCELQASLVHCL